MTTKMKVLSNRANAKLSTGPQTAEGKACSSRNSFQHGLLSAEALLADESAGTFTEFARCLRQELQPEGALEQLLAERIIAAAWRLRRVLVVERGVFEARRSQVHPIAGGLHFDGGLGSTFLWHASASDAFSKLSKYETAIERSLFRSLHELQRLQAVRKGEQVPAPIAVDVDVGLSGEGG